MTVPRRKLKPLPPDLARHQDSAIALITIASVVSVPITSFFIAFPHFSMLEFRRTIHLHLRPHQAPALTGRRGDEGGRL